MNSVTMIGVDINVLLQALLQDDEVQSTIANKLLHSFTPQSPGFITQVTLGETYWILSRTLKMP